MKICLTCSRKEKERWTLSDAEAKHHKDRYQNHTIQDFKEEDGKKKGKSE